MTRYFSDVIAVCMILGSGALSWSSTVISDARAEGTVSEAASLSLYDMHIHYNTPARKVFEPDYVKQLLDAAKVERILVGSWSDDGTLELVKKFPDLVVPEFSPYRGGIFSRNWTKYPKDVLPYMRERLATHPYAGIGEIHIYKVEDVDWDVIREVVAIAKKGGLFLHVHCKKAALDRIYQIAPDIQILWAHAGLSETVENIGLAMKRYPSLVTELSLRAINIIPEDEGADLRPEWRKLLTDFQDRMVVGSDTYMNLSWAEYDEIIASHRRWLGKLPPAVAKKIASENAKTFLARFPPRKVP